MANIAMTTGAGSTEFNRRRDELIEELSKSEKYHRRRGTFDASLHQALVILSAVAGFVSFAAGLVWRDQGWIAGIIGAIPSLATVLALRLHCVKAANLHVRKAQELESLRYRLQFEGDDVAVVSKDFREISEKATSAWELATATDELTDSSPRSSSSSKHGRQPAVASSPH